MMAPCQQTGAIDNAMGGDGVFDQMPADHSPSNHTGGATGAQGGGDGAIGGDAAFWYLTGDGMHQLEEIVILLAGGADGGELFADGCARAASRLFGGGLTHFSNS